MNDPISRQLPLMDAGGSSRYVERSPQQRKIAAVVETEKSRGKEQVAADHLDNAEDREDLAEKVDQLNMQLQEMQRGLRFSIDDSSGRIVVKVIDLATDEVVRQIPSEEMLAMIRNASDGGNVIFNDEA